jgi:hypothetical protein
MNHIIDYGLDKILIDIKEAYDNLKIKHNEELKAILKVKNQVKELFNRYQSYS